MPTTIKVQQIETLVERFSTATALVVSDYRGLSAQEMVSLRERFTKNELEYRVVKNTLARVAAERAKVNDIAQLVEGPTSICFGYDDPALPFKICREVQQTYPAYKIRGGFIEGELVTVEEVARIADLPSREVLLAQVASTLNGPVRNLAVTLKGIIQGLAVVLSQVVEQKTDGTEVSASESESESEGGSETMSHDEILETIEEMKVRELADLVSLIEERFNVSAAAAAVVQAAPTGDQTTTATTEETSTMSVVLTNAGQKKIQVIKLIKEITGKGLKESKALVDSLPQPIREGVEAEEVETLRKQFEELGAEVEIR
ncbi:MAG: 50S ribosomal protein L10 [Candidatus Bipolaricaulia bacterium]